MLKIPTADEISSVEDNGFVRKYTLRETEYCDKCGFVTLNELISIPDYDYWFVLVCAQCSGIERKVYERQTMPFCEECNEHFKMGKREVPMKIYDELGKRICPNCAPNYLHKLRKAQQ